VSWKRAINSLPKEDLTDDDLRRKNEYEVKLATAEDQRKRATEYQAMLAAAKANLNIADHSVIPESLKNRPWVRAMTMIPELVRRREEMKKSSVSALVVSLIHVNQHRLSFTQAWVIAIAYKVGTNALHTNLGLTNHV
jgi:hypothetical protein